MAKKSPNGDTALLNNRVIVYDAPAPLKGEITLPTSWITPRQSLIYYRRQGYLFEQQGTDFIVDTMAMSRHLYCIAPLCHFELTLPDGTPFPITDELLLDMDGYPNSLADLVWDKTADFFPQKV